MYAVIKTGGKQYRVEKGDIIYVEKLPAEMGDNVVFEDVLAAGADGKVKVGAPYVAGVTVTGEVLKNGKGKKLNIFTYRPKKGSARRVGHRQPFTKVEITGITGMAPEKKAAAKTADKKTATKADDKKADTKTAAKKPAAKKTETKPAAKKTADKKEDK